MILESLIDELFKSDGTKTDKEILNSFTSKDSLCPEIFEGTDGQYKMISDIRENLTSISNAFVEYIDLDFFIHDIVLTGSLANFNWSEFSDVDLHILLDMDEFDESAGADSVVLHKIVKEFFDGKRQLWNNNHDISVKGFEVEVYVQDINEKHESTGVYSILNNKWVIEPQKLESAKDLDKSIILSKATDFMKVIDDLGEKSKSGEDVINKIEEVRKRLKKFRQSGLDDGGEYSYENLAFKLLRRNGYVEKLLTLKNSQMDKKLSVADQ